MELVSKFLYFTNSILSINVINNITLLDLIVYILLISAVIGILKVVTSGHK